MLSTVGCAAAAMQLVHKSLQSDVISLVCHSTISSVVFYLCSSQLQYHGCICRAADLSNNMGLVDKQKQHMQYTSIQSNYIL